MFIALIVIFALLWGYLFFKYSDIFSPWNVTLLIWIFIISMYSFLDHGLYKADNQFIKAILIWNTGFCVSSYLSFRITPAYQKESWAKNYQTIKIIKWICLLLVPYMLYKSISFALTNGSVADLIFNLRQQTVLEDSGFSLGPLIYLVHVAYVLLLVTIDEEKINRKQFWLAFILCFTFFIVTMSKLTLFMIIVSILYLLYVYRKITIKPFLICGIIFFVFGLLFTNLRVTDSSGESGFDFMDLVGMYVVSPVVSFCYETPCSSDLWGENTFRGYYSLMNALGFVNFIPPKFQEWVSVPIPTNVFTMMSPYFKDFGYSGLAVLSIAEGIFMGYVYKNSETGNNIMRLIYTYILTLLILQFFDELFLVGLSNFIQIVILILLCHTKFVFNEKNIN